MDVAAILEPLVAGVEVEPDVQAVAVVGSRSSGLATERSDIDIFVYLDLSSPDDARPMRQRLAGALADSARVAVVGQTGHDYADVWALPGTEVYLDLMFWTQAWAEEELEWRLTRHCPQVGGASTAFWRSIRDGIPVFDRSGWLHEIRQRARSPYPDELRATILRFNDDLLGRANPFSFLQQAEGVIAARDRVAAQHRVARWLASYFDYLFAANRVLHPGEKRLVEIAERECLLVPKAMGADVEELVGLSAELSADAVPLMERMLSQLRAIASR